MHVNKYSPYRVLTGGARTEENRAQGGSEERVQLCPVWEGRQESGNSERGRKGGHS